MPHRIGTVILALLAAVMLAGAASRPVAAEDRVIKVGTLKLIHAITPYFYEKFTPPGYKVEIFPFESPTDGKNAVVTMFDVADGAKADTMSPGAAVGHNSGWIDMIHAIHACQRSNGEYLVLVEEDWRGKNIVYQWRPATPPK